MSQETKNFYIRFFIGGIVTGLIGMSVHLLFINRVNNFLSNNLQGVTILHPPYPMYINVMAWITSILPGIGIGILYYLISPSFKFKSRLSKGLVFSLLFLFAEGTLIRQPIMNVLVGNPIWVALIQELFQVWLPPLCMGIAIAYLLPERDK